MKKALALLLSLAMIVSLAACGSKQETTTTTKSGSAATTTKNSGSDATTTGTTAAPTKDYSKYQITEDVTITFWHNYSNAARAQFLQDCADAFTAANPHVKIELVNYGGYPAIREAVAGAVSAGTGLPTMSTINAPTVQVYAESGITVALNEYFEAYGVAVDEYYEGMIDSATYEADDQFYALPFGVSAGVIMINKTMCEKYSLPFPENWEEFKVWCKKMTEASGYPAFGFPYDFNYMNTFFLNVTGMDPLGDGTKSNLDNAAVMSFIMDVRELVQNGYALYVGEKLNSAQDSSLALFGAGQLCAYSDTSSGLVKAINAGKNAAEPFEVTCAIGVSNTGEKPISTVSGAFVIVYDDDSQITQQQKNAAVQFAIYLTNAENISKWAVDTQMFAVRPACDISKLLEKYPDLEPVLGHAEQIKTKNKVSCMQKAMEQVVGVFGDIVKGDVAEKDIASVWATLTKEVNGMLADAQ